MKRSRFECLLFGVALTVSGVGCSPGHDEEAVGLSTAALVTGTFAVKPSADDLKTGVVGVGDTSQLWKNVDDGTAFATADNDTTYVSSGTSTTAIHRVRYAGGKAGTASQVVVRYRARTSSAGGTAQVKLYDGETVVGTGTLRTLSGSWTDYSETFTGLAVADVSSLRTEVTLRRTSGTGNLRYTTIWIEATLHPVSHTVEALIYRDLDTCVVGATCTSGTCAGLYDDAGQRVVSYENAENHGGLHFQAVPPSHPLCTSAAQKRRIRFTMNDTEVATVRRELDLFRSNVFRWSNGELNLRVNVREIPRVTEARLGGWGESLFMGSDGIESTGRSYLSRFNDFTIVVPATRDPVQALRTHDSFCGGTYGAESGVSGAGHTWIPFGWCSQQLVFTHEWLHQVDYAVHVLSGFNSIYPGNSFPACGAGDPDPTKWFPDTHAWASDPDANYCGQAHPGDDTINAHVLGAHWKAGRVLIGNHCTDNVQNFDETQVDLASDCPGIFVLTPPASGVTASSHDGNVPANTVDDNEATRWSASGDGQWLQFNLGAIKRISHLGIATYAGDNRRNLFDLQVSTNGTSWTTVFSGSTGGTVTNQERVDIADVDARYVRYVGHGNHSGDGTFSLWNSVTEVDIFGPQP